MIFIDKQELEKFLGEAFSLIYDMKKRLIDAQRTGNVSRGTGTYERSDYQRDLMKLTGVSQKTLSSFFDKHKSDMEFQDKLPTK